MGNFEKLSVLVIVVIIVMILVVALYTWQDNSDESTTLNAAGEGAGGTGPATAAIIDPPDAFPEPEDELRPEESWSLDDRDSAGEEFSSEPEIDVPLSGGEDVPDMEPIIVATPAPISEDVEEDGGGDWIYIIKDGDSLSVIAQRELGTVRRLKDLMAKNPGIDPLKIRAGDQLDMPPKGMNGSMRVEPGSSGSDTSGSSNSGGGTSRCKISTGEYYVSKAGDTVQGIAKRAWGSLERWPELWARNLSAIPSIDTAIPTGTRVFIPN